MDNIAFHTVEATEQAITNTAATTIYLPPYSPNLSPLELIWAKAKSMLRKFAPRTAGPFQKAIGAAFNAISPSG